MVTIKKIGTLLDILTSHIIHGFSFFIPRNKKIWIFIGTHKGRRGEVFTDNSKYLFLYVSNNIKNIKAVWIGMDKNICKTLQANGYTAYYKNEFLGIYHSLRAGYTFIDAFFQRENYRYSGGSKIIQLLHGRGMKKRGYGTPEYFNNFSPVKKFFFRLTTPQTFLLYDYLFSPSEFVSGMLPEEWKVKKTKFFITGYPRNDIFFRESKGAEIGVSLNLKEKLRQLRQNGTKNFVLYMPTFRRGSLNFELEKIINVSQLSLLMKQQKAHFFIKLHPKFGRKKIKPIESDYITFIDESDLHCLLKEFNLLITDYSSIFVDFLLLEKPIVFFPYDLENYRKKEGFALDYEKYTPGPKVFNWQELLQSIKKFLQGEDEFEKEREKIKNLYHQYTDGKSSERITNILLSKKSILNSLNILF